MLDLLSRRRLLSASAAWLGFGWAGRPVAAQSLPATPACDDHAPTAQETEGPFYKPRSPERSDLRSAGLAGQPLELTGRVLTRDCRPLAGVLIDVWQADSEGRYDNTGFTLRGHQHTDGEGRWRLHSIVPGAYEGRTRHIHVKVQAPGGRLLTTQLYFPGEAKNRRDPLFRPDLLIRTRDGGDALAGHFDFVLGLG